MMLRDIKAQPRDARRSPEDYKAEHKSKVTPLTASLIAQMQWWPHSHACLELEAPSQGD